MQFVRGFFAVSLIVALPVLSACVPAVVVSGAAVGVMSVHDRRSTGVQTDDELTEWKASNRLPQRLANAAHVNFVSYNRVLLITGEAVDEETRAAIGSLAAAVEGVKKVHNELLIAPPSSLASRSNDGLISTKFKARLVESNQLSSNHIKPVTENGTLFLMGLLNEQEARVAVSIARTTDGVRKVVSLFEVLPDTEIRRIDSALLGASPVPPNVAAPVEVRHGAKP